MDFDAGQTLLSFLPIFLILAFVVGYVFFRRRRSRG